MKTLFLILICATITIAQTPNWKLIKEFSGEIDNHPGITVEISAAEIARGDDLIKLLFKAEFPNGAPRDLFTENVPRGFDVTSIFRIQGQLKFDCGTLVVTPVPGSAEVYQFNGKKFKSKEPPFTIPAGHVFAQYFCEQGAAPVSAPTLKPAVKPSPTPTGKSLIGQ